MSRLSLSSRLPLSVLLFSLLLLALWLRWDTYPRTYFADELIPQAVIKHMQVTGTLDTNWEHADWRGDYAGAFYKLRQYNFSSYHTALFFFQQSLSFFGVHDVPPLGIYRVFSLLCQLGALLLVFFVAKRLYGGNAALLAAVFFAVVPQAVVDAHYARPESFVIFLVVLACGLSLKACAEKSVRYSLAEALVWGVAFACKFSFFPMVLIAYTASCFFIRRWEIFLSWPACFVMGIVISAPYIALDMAGFWHGIGLLMHQYSAQAVREGWLDSHLPSIKPMAAYLGVFFGFPVFAVMLCSCFARQRQGRVFAFLVLCISFFYIFVFSLQGVFFERNLSHLLPLWAVVFGGGSAFLLQRMQGKNPFFAMSLLLCAIVLWLAFLSLRIDRELFSGIAENKKLIFLDEEDLLKRTGAARIVAWNVMRDPDDAGNADSSVIFRVPLSKAPDGSLIMQAFLRNGFKQVAYRELPLAFLPYNQLQVNQLPVAYVYYRRSAPDNGDATP